MSKSNVVVSVAVPQFIYVLAGRTRPTRDQARLFRTKEWGGGSLDGMVMQMPNTVDWTNSEIDLSPLIPWLGNPDSLWPRKLAKILVAKWPELKGQLEVIRLQVEIIGDGYQWGDLIRVRAV